MSDYESEDYDYSEHSEDDLPAEYDVYHGTEDPPDETADDVSDNSDEELPPIISDIVTLPESEIENIEPQSFCEILVIPDEDRRTSNKLTLYEQVALITHRTRMIQVNNDCFIPIVEGASAVQLAKEELMQRKCPLIARRCVGVIYDKKTRRYCDAYEFWNPNNMTFAKIYKPLAAVIRKQLKNN